MRSDSLEERMLRLESQLHVWRRRTATLGVLLLALAVWTHGPWSPGTMVYPQELTLRRLLLEADGVIGELTPDRLLLGGTRGRYDSDWPVVLEADDGVAAALRLVGDGATTWMRAGRTELTSKKGILELSAAPHILLLGQGGAAPARAGQAEFLPSSISIQGVGGSVALTAHDGEHGLTVSNREGKLLESVPR